MVVGDHTTDAPGLGVDVLDVCRADYIVDFLGELVNWDFVNSQLEG